MEPLCSGTDYLKAPIAMHLVICQKQDVFGVIYTLQKEAFGDHIPPLRSPPSQPPSKTTSHVPSETYTIPSYSFKYKQEGREGKTYSTNQLFGVCSLGYYTSPETQPPCHTASLKLLATHKPRYGNFASIRSCAKSFFFLTRRFCFLNLLRYLFWFWGFFLKEKT